MSQQRTMIIAHRGAAGEAPENTISAFKLGLEQGCEGIELDVHLSKDGEIVVIHDSTINRTTHSKGAVNELTVAELKQADAGLWFHEQYAGERIPLLEEVFELVPPEVMINVEIKGSYGYRLEPALAALMRRMDRVHNVVVSSFDFKSLQALKLHEPEAKLGLLYDLSVARHADMTKLISSPVYSLHPSFRRLDKADVRDAVESGLQVYAYTINDEDKMRQAIEYGVSGIITDYPGRLKGLLT
ncbi:glycerophosphoryl diester phosphodiesterase [Paenibacillus sp. UNCCL117]|uniref:glycerophosphodiester phosphodiesterase n=1 Tax=unclassified Paenibacillus TaxID=185978 RepID=UPI000886686C|nr:MULTISPECIES: glycerophosphodiester phosphodiesterase [unclassified Paenibacillus]SDD82386.1 glycerophosphoryl diester phosphodiesterase [Paenibacillus sp. cl123]SFW55162.1 glycerophosphoryl diester phosphodiesterase [Paenibacillus sp. UNCCL117]